MTACRLLDQTNAASGRCHPKRRQPTALLVQELGACRFLPIVHGHNRITRDHDGWAGAQLAPHKTVYLGQASQFTPPHELLHDVEREAAWSDPLEGERAQRRISVSERSHHFAVREVLDSPVRVKVEDPLLSWEVHIQVARAFETFNVSLISAMQFMMAT